MPRTRTTTKPSAAEPKMYRVTHREPLEGDDSIVRPIVKEDILAYSFMIQHGGTLILWRLGQDERRLPRLWGPGEWLGVEELE